MFKSKLFKPVFTSVLAVSVFFGSVSLLAPINESSIVHAAAKPPSTAFKSKVTDVVDGDTIKLMYKGRKETVRFILIDTPETKKPQTCVQLFGPEASAYTKNALLNKEVKVELGVDTRDQYGRLLAYIYIKDVMFNKTLLEKGLARVAIYKPNTKYLEELQAVEKVAKGKKSGIWSSVNARNGGCAPKVAPAPKPVITKPAPKPITPAKAEVFKNCTELRKKYPSGVAKGHPAYQSKMDRDKDNWACER